MPGTIINKTTDKQNLAHVLSFSKGNTPFVSNKIKFNYYEVKVKKIDFFKQSQGTVKLHRVFLSRCR